MCIRDRANVEASNGVVHIIDSVLIPPAMQAEITASQNIVQLASATADLSTLVAAVKAGGLVDTLSGTGPFTVFAPTNDAFAALPAGTLEKLLKPENKALLIKVLEYHVIAGKAVYAAQIKDGMDAKTLEGQTVEFGVDGSTVEVIGKPGNEATVAKANIKASRSP